MKSPTRPYARRRTKFERPEAEKHPPSLQILGVCADLPAAHQHRNSAKINPIRARRTNHVQNG
jgi:hypothetical protein